LRAREGRPVSLATQFIVKLPTCNKDKLSEYNPSCTGKTDLGILGIASKSFRSVDVHLNVGYTVVGDPAGISLRDTVSYSLGFDYTLPASPFRLLAEVSGQTSSNPADSIHPLTGLLAASYAVNPLLVFDAGIGRGLTSSSAQVVASAGLTLRF
jgi:hypothetical protein